MLRYLKALAEHRGGHPVHLHEEAREAGWTDEQLLEAIALVSLESFTAMANLAGEVPVDGSVEETRVLRAALSMTAGEHRGVGVGTLAPTGGGAAGAAVRACTRRSSSSASAGPARSWR